MFLIRLSCTKRYSPLSPLKRLKREVRERKRKTECLSQCVCVCVCERERERERGERERERERASNWHILNPHWHFLFLVFRREGSCYNKFALSFSFELHDQHDLVSAKFFKTAQLCRSPASSAQTHRAMMTRSVGSPTTRFPRSSAATN